MKSKEHPSHHQPSYRPTIKEDDFSTPKEASFSARTLMKEKPKHMSGQHQLQRQFKHMPTQHQLKSGIAGRVNAIPTAHVTPSRPAAVSDAAGRTDMCTSRIPLSRQWSNSNVTTAQEFVHGGEFSALPQDVDMSSMQEAIDCYVTPRHTSHTSHPGSSSKTSLHPLSAHSGVHVTAHPALTSLSQTQSQNTSSHSIYSNSGATSPRQYRSTGALPHGAISYMAGQPNTAERGGDEYKSLHRLRSHASSSNIMQHTLNTNPDTRELTSPRHSDPGSYTSAAAADHELSSWQKRHQEQLRHQQIEATQGLYAGTSSISMVADTLDPVRRAADSIIHGKDSIIEQQRQRISQLETRTGGDVILPGPTHTSLMQTHGDERDILARRVQQLELDNSLLHTRLNDAQLGQPNTSLHTLERKLNEREYEYRKLQESMKQQEKASNIEQSRLHDQINRENEATSEWKSRYESLLEEDTKKEKEMASQKRYMEDMPSLDEWDKKKQEVASLREDRVRLKSRVTDLDRHLQESNKAKQSCEQHITAIVQELADSKTLTEKVKCDNLKLRQRLGLAGQDGTPTSIEGEMEQLKIDNQSLRVEMGKAKKLLEISHAQQNHVEQQHASSTQQLEESLATEERHATALKDDLSSKENELRVVRAQLKKVSVEYQGLLEQNMSLSECVRGYEAAATGDMARLEKQLRQDMSVAVMELEGLIQICVQRAEGQDPNISLLLGVRGKNVDVQQSSEVQTEDSIAAMKQKLQKVEELRHKVDKLREVISNKYAEDLGDHLDPQCATQ